MGSDQQKLWDSSGSQLEKKPITFLHVADVHLGYDKYDNPERSKDFFLAFRDLLLRHALQDPVDFVLIAGDLFEYRSILPHVLNQAELALRPLQEAGIPVLAIEGNHDNRPFGVKTTWLRYLSDHDLLILLEPNEASEGIQLERWDPARKRGGYIDLDCGIRVIGSQWYGSAAPRSIQLLASGIESLPAWDGPTILMFHHGMEGQIARYEGALRYKDLLPLRDVGIDYLALGHIHKHYSVENWIFNPGSTEANNVEESSFDRGGLKVQVFSEPSGSIHIEAQLIQDYYQRPIHRLRIEAKGKEKVEDIREQILESVRQKAKL
jgi:exonuclease SbcD